MGTATLIVILIALLFILNEQMDGTLSTMARYLWPYLVVTLVVGYFIWRLFGI